MHKIDNILPFYGTKFPLNFYPELTKTILIDQLKRAMLGETSCSEYPAADTEGNEVWFETSLVPVRDDKSHVRYIIVTSVDITNRKQAEKALRSADIRNFTLMEKSPVCNKIIDLDSRLQYMSPAGQRMLKIGNITPFYGTKFPPNFFPKSTQILLTTRLEQAKKGEASTLEFQAATINGDEAWFQSYFAPVRNDQGDVEYIIVTSVEITERKKTEALLKYQAYHDELTGLVNCREFEHQANQLLSTIEQVEGEHALCFMDLDQFKIINDTYGHATGDELLRQISVELKKSVRQKDTIAR